MSNDFFNEHPLLGGMFDFDRNGSIDPGEAAFMASMGALFASEMANSSDESEHERYSWDDDDDPDEYDDDYYDNFDDGYDDDSDDYDDDYYNDDAYEDDDDLDDYDYDEFADRRRKNRRTNETWDFGFDTEDDDW